ncbi:MAG: glycosyltransferase family 1 protein [Rhodospirillaceae bacterium]|nr:glycosyltransferase family 1 protein [Rhodospirillaceae bacterium]
MNAINPILDVGRPERSRMAAPLRVALFSGNYNYHMDGPVRALNRLVAHLGHRGAAVMVFAPTTDTPACEAAGTLVPIPSIPAPGRPEYRLGLGLPAPVRAALTAFAPNVIHLSAPDLSGYAALRYARRRGLPAVASFHTRFDTYLDYYGAGWLQPAVTAYLRHFYRQCRQLYAPSASMAAELSRAGMCADIRIWGRGIDRAVFNPAHRDLTWRRSLGIADGEPVIAFVGRVVMEKGLGAFADAIDGLTARGIAHRVLIVGDGPARPWLAARLPQAVFVGFQRDQGLSRAYASADIFFNPSCTETFGNVTAEAMASGLPSVCADATGSRSLVIHGETGFLVPPNRPAGYVEALSMLATSTDLRGAFGTAALERSAAYDWDRVLDHVTGHYLEVLAAGDGDRVARPARLRPHEPALGETAA